MKKNQMCEDQKRHRYILMRWQQYEKLFLPSIDGRLIQSSLTIHKSTSIKGKIFHKILESKTSIRILEQFSIVSYEEPKRFGSFRWKEWKNQALKILDINEGWVSFSFPQNEDRRFVAILLDNNAQARGFAKVALDEKTKTLFQNEVNGLRYFSQIKLKHFCVPSVLFEGEFEGAYYFIQSLIPHKTNYYSNFNDKNWIELVNEIISSSISHETLRTQPWWTKLKTMSTPTVNLIPFLESEVTESIQVCNTHGDLGPGNIRFQNNNFWIYDWEGFNKQAPIMTDYLSFVIEHFIKSPFLSYSNKANKILYYLSENIPYASKCNIALALAYLSTSRNWTLNDKMSLELCKALLRRN
ncbi:MAG: hypothetical protein Q8M15_01775 [Bacteroidota bacterium]|nr:hypothetical protein [Bacteroidota bacterium]